MLAYPFEVEQGRIIEFRQVSVDSEDLKSLQPGHMLKGAVINLFIKHLDYGNNQEKDSNIETYSTDFYPMLCKEGIEKVMTWQGIDPFNRKIINLPICFGNHQLASASGCLA